MPTITDAMREAAGTAPRETNPIKKFLNKPTKAGAIKAKCAEYVGCTASHVEQGWKETIAGCTSYGCPLRMFRPFQPKQQKKDE